MRNGHLLDYVNTHTATSAMINHLVCGHAPLAVHMVIFFSFLMLRKE
jgi:hypothetical protein